MYMYNIALSCGYTLCMQHVMLHVYMYIYTCFVVFDTQCCSYYNYNCLYYANTGNAVIFFRLYRNLCTDDTPMVRRAAAGKLGVS